MGAEGQRGLPWGWIGFFSALVLLALLSAAALLEGGRQLAEQREQLSRQPLWRILVHGEVYLLDEAEYARFRQAVEQGTDRELARLLAAGDETVRLEVARAFAPVHRAVPRYADWYYSLTAEYLRYAHALAGGLAGHMEEQLHRILFEESGGVEALDALPEALQQALSERMAAAGKAILERAVAVLPAEGGRDGGPDWELAGELSLDRALSEALAPPEGLAARQLASLGAGAGAAVLAAKGSGALVAKKVVAKMAGGKTFQLAAALAGKAAVKGAVKGGGVLAGGGGGGGGGRGGCVVRRRRRRPGLQSRRSPGPALRCGGRRRHLAGGGPGGPGAGRTAGTGAVRGRAPRGPAGGGGGADGPAPAAPRRLDPPAPGGLPPPGGVAGESAGGLSAAGGAQ